MNKEEILAKSRKENVLQDEMERTVRIEGESFSLILVFLVGVVIVIFNRLHGLPPTVCWPCSGPPVWATASTVSPSGGTPPTW